MWGLFVEKGWAERGMNERMNLVVRGREVGKERGVALGGRRA